MAVSGDACATFASNNGITPAQLYAWNSVLGANGAYCASSFWAEEYYCVGVSSGSSTTTITPGTSTAVTAPGPTQTGITSSCNKYAMAASGDTCAAFASAHGITAAQLYAWNTVLGTNGRTAGRRSRQRSIIVWEVSSTAAKLRREEMGEGGNVVVVEKPAHRRYIRGVE